MCAIAISVENEGFREREPFSGSPRHPLRVRYQGLGPYFHFHRAFPRRCVSTCEAMMARLGAQAIFEIANVSLFAAALADMRPRGRNPHRAS